jgi:hypothetical protein
MSGVKTSDETAASALSGTEFLRGVQAGANVKITIAQIKTYLLGANTFTATQTITPAANTQALTISGGSVTGTGTSAFASIAGTWNTTGIPTALTVTITDTTSDGASLLADFKVGATSVFAVNKTGINIGTAYLADTGSAQLRINSQYYFSAVGLALTDTYAGQTGIVWNTAFSTSPDLLLQRLAAANLKQGGLPSATPIAQKFTLGEASRPGTDSNVGGASGTIQPGLGTGTGTLSKLILQGTVLAASGTGTQTYASAITINSTLATGLQFNGYGAGAITSDGSGNLTAASDPRLKNIQRQFSPGLAELSRIKPIVYKWRPESGMEPENEYAGFDAENVREAIELATWKGKDGLLSLQDRALLAACVNAINELAARSEA